MSAPLPALPPPAAAYRLLPLSPPPSTHPLVQDSRSTRKEARQWLINSIAAVDLRHAATKCPRFSQFLPGGATCRGAEHAALGQAALQLLFEAAPAEVRVIEWRDKCRLA